MDLGEVKSHLSELVGRVHDHHERVTVTVHGRPSAVLVALEDLERLEETLEILRDPETVKRLASSDAELARGESVSAEELADYAATPVEVSGEDSGSSYILRTTLTVRRALSGLFPKRWPRPPTSS
jgi:prevent-host-death family protein